MASDCCFVFSWSDLGSLYIKAGVKNIGAVFLMTDAQVTDEKLLVLVNDLLASGKPCCQTLPDDMHAVYSYVVLRILLAILTSYCFLFSHYVS